MAERDDAFAASAEPPDAGQTRFAPPETGWLGPSEAVRSAAEAVAAEPDLQALLQKLTDAATTACRARCGAFFLTDRLCEQEAPAPSAVSGEPREWLEQFDLHTGGAALRRAFESGRAARCDDATPSPGATPLLEPLANPAGSLRSHLTVPAVGPGGEVLGGFFFGDARPSRFTQEAERVAAAIAALAAVGILHARLRAQSHQDASQRTLAEAALEESQSRLHLAMEAGSMGTWDWDISTGRVVWSPGLARMHRRDPAAFGGTIEDALADVHPDDRELLGARIRAAVDESAPYHHEYRIITPDGEERRVEARGRVFRDADGRAVRMSGVCADVTDRSLADRARALLASIVESSDDAIVSKTLDGVITSWNAGARRIFGYEADEAVGKHVTMLIPPERHAEEREIIAKLRAGSRVEHFETVRLAKDGREIPVSLTISPIIDERGEIVGASKIARDISIAKQAELVRAESERRYAELIRSVPIALYSCDPDGRVSLWNEAAERIWGRTPVPGADRWCGSLRIHSADGRLLPHDECPMAVTLRERRASPPTELIYERPDGSRMHVIVHPQPTFDAAGCFVGATNSIVDISPRKQAEEALRESEEKFRALADNMSQLAWMCDARGDATWYNRRWYDYTGASWERARGDGWKQVVHPEHRERVAAGFSEAAAAGAVWEDTFPVRGADGGYRWFLSRAVPIRDQSGDITRWIGTNTDITDLRSAEAAARESESRFRVMADSAPVLVWIADTDKRCVWVNRPWLDFTGRSMEQEIGEGWLEGVHRDDADRCRETYVEAFDARREFRVHYRLRRHDGVHRWVLNHGIPLHDPRGEFIGYIGSCIDVSDEVNARAAMERQQAVLEQAVRERTAELEESHRRLRISERMASIGTLSAGLGHDLSNVLLPIRLRLDTMEQLADNEGVLHEVHEVRSAVEYLQNLASGLRMLVVDPAERTGADSTELRAWWRQASAILRSTAPSSIELRGSMPDEECWVRFTPTALTQCVFNLVQNAADALRGRGQGLVEVRVARTDQRVTLSVRDDGPGMSDEVRERCTQPFFSTKTRGMSTGLGLALVYGMVREAEGLLEVESELGVGTNVSMHLRPAEPPRRERADRGDAPRALVKLRDPRVRAIVCAELEGLGFRTVECGGQTPVPLCIVDSPGVRAATGAAVTVRLHGAGTTGVDALRITEVRRCVREAAQEVLSRTSGAQPRA